MTAQRKTREDTRWITERAQAIGFDLCGVVAADRFPELERMPEWLGRGYAGEMHYLEDLRRGDPREAREGVHSAVMCALSYNTGLPYSTKMAAVNSHTSGGTRGWISRYAWGDDYHEILRGMLDRLVNELRGRFGEDSAWHACADTGPVHERVLAKYAGLGWIGKNTLLLNQKLGSWLFLGAVLSSLELEPSLAPAEAPPPDLCGTCRKCLDACPTEAFVEPYVMDARRCISYLTIELRGTIPEELREAMGWHVFGCDICQDVCPWNSKSTRSYVIGFEPRGTREGTHALFMPQLEWLAGMSIETFREVFRGSAIKRTKWRGLVRNACIALGNAEADQHEETAHRITSLLTELSANEDQVIAESARWALRRIQEKGSREGSGRGAN